MIGYVAPDIKTPSGGVKTIYRHVDVLNRRGLDAVVLHAGRGFRCDWFENETRVRCMGDVSKRDLDVLVIPEIYGPRSAERIRMKVNSVFGIKRPVIHDVSGIRKLVFNQSGYYTFYKYLADGADQNGPYTHPEVEGAIVVSEDTRAYLRLAFPGLTIHRVRPSIRTDVFRDGEARQRQIAYMPWKNKKEVAQVFHLLRFMGALDGWTLAPIQGMPEREVARILQESAFFFTFAYPEGFNLPPLEAMASGCVVVGYHGFGGREYFRPGLCHPVETGDVQAFARTAAEALRSWTRDPTPLRAMGNAASEFARREYPPEREEEELVDLWRRLLDGAARTPR